MLHRTRTVAAGRSTGRSTAARSPGRRCGLHGPDGSGHSGGVPERSPQERPGDVRVSVVIPARDAAATLGAQLTALSAQRTTRRYEVVVADNGSTDGTAALARSFAGRVPGLRVVDAGARAGTNAARNAGVSAARGELVLLCDADDVVDEGWLDALAAALEHADAVGGPLERESLNDAFVRDWGPPPENTGVYQHLDFLPRPTGANAGFRRAVWEELGGFDERYVRGGTETEFFWRLQLAGHRLTAVPGALVHYRLRSTARAQLRQWYTWGRQYPMLYRDFRAHGMRWRPAQAARGWAGALRRLPRVLGATPSGRLDAVRPIVVRVGRLVGSVKHRVLYL